MQKIAHAHTVLLVSDDPKPPKALSPYELLTTPSFQDALKIIENQEVAVIVCHQSHASLDFLHRSRDLCPDASRILLVDSNLNPALATATVDDDITFFLPKPLEDALFEKALQKAISLHKRSHTRLAIDDLVRRQHSQLAKAHEVLRHELHIGSRIYDVFLGKQSPEEMEGFEVAALTIPSQDIDGDFYAFYNPSDEVVDLAFGDVMGKGLPAALIGTAVQNQLTHFALPLRNSLSCDPKGIWRSDLYSPETIMEKTHEEVINKLFDLQFFVSLFYARFHPMEKRLTYVDCGSTKPLHVRGDEITSLEGDNFPLGMVAETKYLAKQFRYRVDDLFIFYSDGVTEAKDKQNNLFGLEGLQSVVKANADKTPEEIVRAITMAVENYANGVPLGDDLTLVVIRIKEPKVTKPGEKSATFASDLSQLPAVRQFVDRALDRDEEFSNQLQLAINEIFCNIVKHGEDPVNITVSIKVLDDGIAVDVADEGTAFDPREIEEPNFSGHQDDGFGLFMVKSIADRVTYKAGGEGEKNHHRLFKRFRNQEETMLVSHNTHGNVLVVSIDGEHLDAKQAPLFKERVIDLVGDKGGNNVVLDLSKLQFIDSSGLGSLLSILRFLNTNQGNLKIANVSRPVRATFEIVRMHKLFEIFNSTDEALRSFEG